MSLFYASSGIGQTASGLPRRSLGRAPRAADRHGSSRWSDGARRGWRPSYLALRGGRAPGGLGNSVFHPADYSIFNASISPRRLWPRLRRPLASAATSAGPWRPAVVVDRCPCDDRLAPGASSRWASLASRRQSRSRRRARRSTTGASPIGLRGAPSSGLDGQREAPHGDAHPGRLRLLRAPGDRAHRHPDLLRLGHGRDLRGASLGLATGALTAFAPGQRRRHPRRGLPRDRHQPSRRDRGRRHVPGAPAGARVIASAAAASGAAAGRMALGRLSAWALPRLPATCWCAGVARAASASEGVRLRSTLGLGPGPRRSPRFSSAGCSTAASRAWSSWPLRAFMLPDHRHRHSSSSPRGRRPIRAHSACYFGRTSLTYRSTPRVRPRAPGPASGLPQPPAVEGAFKSFYK